MKQDSYFLLDICQYKPAYLQGNLSHTRRYSFFLPQHKNFAKLCPDLLEIGRTLPLNADQGFKTLIHLLVALVVFEFFDLLTNDSISSEFTDKKRSIIVLIGIFFLFFNTKLNFFSQIDCFYFQTFDFKN